MPHPTLSQCKLEQTDQTSWAHHCANLDLQSLHHCSDSRRLLVGQQGILVVEHCREYCGHTLYSDNIVAGHLDCRIIHLQKKISPRHPSMYSVCEGDLSEGSVSFRSVLLTRFGPWVGGHFCTLYQTCHLGRDVLTRLSPIAWCRVTDHVRL